LTAIITGAVAMTFWGPSALWWVFHNLLTKTYHHSDKEWIEVVLWKDIVG
jgi:hypothetical protein